MARCTEANLIRIGLFLILFLLSNCQNSFLAPVLKHGPRSLTCVQVQGSQSYVRNENKIVYMGVNLA